ncbi:MAG: MaoC family dehydratase N-terminal domain-containing protein [Chloroflexi bacterium]|nr:MaoC family dehydratase N-terminal domain-containing protein [Chloroflexota bacterium]
MATAVTKLTPEVKAMVGVQGEFVEASWWVVEKEGLRRFCQALMDPDPRYWDDEFARTTRYGEVVAPHIYVSYLGRTSPSAGDPVSRAFKEDPVSDGIGGVWEARGGLPNVPTDLKRILNAGNELEVYQLPTLGDRIYCQSRYASIAERTGTDGSPMLIVTTETAYYNQRGDLLCVTRASAIRR